jgi:SAM-dependent methyltransferase
MKLNLDYYTGEDLYSDGSVEDELLTIVENNKNFHEILQQNNSWPILYHLSPVRRNILEWYPFEPNASVLEIGAGCGAITGVLCQKVQKVTAVELSKKRAQIISTRHKDCSNLEIIVGNIGDIQFTEKFDYITLIGVLEYAGKFTGGLSPYVDFVNKVKSNLKPGGTLIIAIENKYGLKYWAGSSEDHTGNTFDGIENYLGNEDINTFSRKELEDLLINSGFQNNEFYYPMPDYKTPTQIFSDQYLPKPGNLNISPNHDRDRLLLFDEKIVFNNIVQNNMFHFFANSFLVFSKE